MKKFLSEFKEFALRGNVLDMAIGVVIGGAFGKITTSLVNDVIMPLVGMLIGGIDLGKRVDFLRETADAMGLRRVRCVHARAEEFARKHREQFDIATSRAVAQLNVLCELTLPLVKVGGVFLAMKSVESDPELQEARSAIAQLGGAVEDVTDYTIPGTEVTHRVVRIRKERPTPAGFPRAFARIKKAPLR